MNRRLLTSDDHLQLAADQLFSGKLVAVPTETVYGLAADASQDTAVENIFVTKGRPSFNPLICHVTGIQMARQISITCPLSESLIKNFWPGPLTIVLPRKSDAPVSTLVTAGLDTIAVRCPAGPLQQICKVLNRPIAAPSANRSGKISSTCFDDVLKEFPDDDFFVIDGGICEVGIESTIVKVQRNQIFLLREGKITQKDVENATGIRWKIPINRTKIQAPGMTKSHYAPDAKVLLLGSIEEITSLLKGIQQEDPNRTTGLLDFGGQLLDLSHSFTVKHFELSEGRNLLIAAKNLYSGLRSLDSCAVDIILVAPIPEKGLGSAIADRLSRAAAKKET